MKQMDFTLHIFNKTHVVWVLLLLLISISALMVVYSSHLSRHLFYDLQAERVIRDELQVEWGQLLLEQSTWSSYGRIEELATNQLGMIVPEPHDLVIAKPK